LLTERDAADARAEANAALARRCAEALQPMVESYEWSLPTEPEALTEEQHEAHKNEARACMEAVFAALGREEKKP
jgi:hypothetical protein